MTLEIKVYQCHAWPLSCGHSCTEFVPSELLRHIMLQPWLRESVAELIFANIGTLKNLLVQDVAKLPILAACVGSDG